MSKKYGGYSDDIFIEKVHERFLCTICFKVLRDPHLMFCCGVKFCESCLEKCTAHRLKRCPHCREEKGHTLEKGMKREIDSFKVHCSQCDLGCEWVNELREMAKHEFHCGCVEVECSNKCESQSGAVTRILRKDFKEHLEQYCELRLVVCEFCNSSFVKNQYTLHIEACDLFPVKCPNECGTVDIPRIAVVSHRTQCPLEVIECGNLHLGCEMQLKREDMYIHKMSCEWRNICCMYCSEMIIYKYTKEHEENCLLFPVHCPNGCEVMTVRSLLDSHISTCELEPVECTLGCKTLIVRSKMRDHVNEECEFRSVNCDYCNDVVLARNLPEHHQTCDDFPVNCPNKCRQKGISRKSLEHHKTVCALEVIECKYANVGCTEKVRRKMLQQHEQRKMKFHLELMNTAYGKTQQKLIEQSQQLKDTQQLLVDKKMQLKQTSLDLEKLTSSLEDSVLNVRDLQFCLEDTEVVQRRKMAALTTS